MIRSVTKKVARNMSGLERQVGKLSFSPASTKILGLLKTLKTKKLTLANLFDGLAQGALVRPQFMNIFQVDESSCFFFGLQKKNGQVVRPALSCRRAVIILLPNEGDPQDIKI